MCRSALLVAVGLLTALSLLVSSGPAWAAANWTVGLKTGSVGGGQGPGPAGGAGGDVRLRQSDQQQRGHRDLGRDHARHELRRLPVDHLGDRHVHAQATVTTATWTSAALATGHYWYEVVANIGTNWASAKSAATAERTTSSTTCS